MGTDTIVKAVMYRSDVDVCRLDRPKVPLHNCEVFVRRGDPGLLADRREGRHFYVVAAMMVVGAGGYLILAG